MNEIDFDNIEINSREDAIKELNEYFKQFVSFDNPSEEDNLNNSSIKQNNIFSIDDTLDMINGDRLRDIDIIETTIDKNKVSGGVDATQIIENMSGGNNKHELSLDEEFDMINSSHDTVDQNETISDNTVNLTGGAKRKTLKMVNVSDITTEINLSKNKKKSRKEIDKNGIIDLEKSMLGGYISDDEENHEDLDSDDDKTPLRDDTDEYEEYSMDSSDDLSDDNDGHIMTHNNEIDLVLEQLKNRIGKTLNGGDLKISKKAVLTELYPYVLNGN